MTTRHMETRLTIRAVDEYSSRIRAMSGTTGRFADRVRADMGRIQAMRGPLQMIGDFRRMRERVDASAVSLEAARERVRQLGAELRTTSTPTARLRRDFDRARGAANRLEAAHRNNRSQLHGLQRGLTEAGVNVRDLAGEERRLTSSIDGANAALGRQVERLQRVEQYQARMATARADMDRGLQRGANLSVAGAGAIYTGRRILSAVAAPVQAAMQFESAMADVSRVVDFDTPDGLQEMGRDILALSREIPLAADGIAQIVAAGGEAGFARDELLDFAGMAARIGVAFDISAEDAGRGMATIRTALGLTLEDTGLVFDAMNHLSNNMAARAPQVLDFMTRVGSDGLRAGFTAQETLAIGSAMIAAGAGADVAGTSFRNVTRMLQRGASATTRQQEALESIGLTATDVASRMQEDAVGTLRDVLTRINQLPEEVRAATISDIFGDEARALGPLISNMALLDDALGLVADETQYAGSATEEFARRSATTEAQLQLMRNSMTELGVTVGSVLLPPLNEFLQYAIDIANRVAEWAEAHPDLTRNLVFGALAAGALAVAVGTALVAVGGIVSTVALAKFGLRALGAGLGFGAGQFLDFSNSVDRRMTRAGNATDREVRRMNRSLRRLRTGSVLASLGRTLLRYGGPAAAAYVGLGIQPTGDGTLEGDNTDGSLPTVFNGQDRDEVQQAMAEAPEAAPVAPQTLPAPIIEAVHVVQRYRTGGQTLPTHEIADLEGQRDALQAQIAEIEAIAATRGHTDQSAALLEDLTTALAEVETELVAAEERSDELGEALRVISDLDVAPQIDTQALDDAIARALELRRQLEATRTAGAGGTPVPDEPVQARARGGTFRPGWLLTGERGPELRYASRAGYIAHHGHLQRLAGLAARAQAWTGPVRSGMSAATIAGLASVSALPTAAAAAAPAAPSIGDVHIGDIVIHAPQVTDPAAVSGMVLDELGDVLRAELTASFSDGG